jgi:drug/metabolite transporter superfamily protein YnfA
MNIQNFYSNGGLDKTGVAVSWICAVHCLMTPILLVSLPLIGLGFLASEQTEYFFIGLSVAIGGAVLLPAFFRRHRKIRTLLLFAAGIFLVISADTLFEESAVGKAVAAVGGAICITTAHLINRRLCLTCPDCSKDACNSLT